MFVPGRVGVTIFRSRGAARGLIALRLVTSYRDPM
jgi:hypothetical protein